MIVLRWSLSADQQKKKTTQDFHKINTGKKKYGGWSEEGIDKMEGSVKEIRLDRGEDPGNGRV
jgi:hypothetical protein